jgi:hypothetical protein
VPNLQPGTRKEDERDLWHMRRTLCPPNRYESAPFHGIVENELHLRPYSTRIGKPNDTIVGVKRRPDMIDTYSAMEHTTQTVRYSARVPIHYHFRLLLNSSRCSWRGSSLYSLGLYSMQLAPVFGAVAAVHSAFVQRTKPPSHSINSCCPTLWRCASIPHVQRGVVMSLACNGRPRCSSSILSLHARITPVAGYALLCIDMISAVAAAPQTLLTLAFVLSAEPPGVVCDENSFVEASGSRASEAAVWHGWLVGGVEISEYWGVQRRRWRPMDYQNFRP